MRCGCETLSTEDVLPEIENLSSIQGILLLK